MGIYELLKHEQSEIAELVVRRAPLADIKEASKANGMKEMQAKMACGKSWTACTTPEEVQPRRLYGRLVKILLFP